MAEEKSHTEQGEIERAQRLRRIIENLKEGHSDDDATPSEGKSLKEKIDERARTAADRPTRHVRWWKNCKCFSRFVRSRRCPASDCEIHSHARPARHARPES